MTLLEEALKCNPGQKTKINTDQLKERIDLVLAYFGGEITPKQLMSVLGKAESYSSTYIGNTLAMAIRQNLITVKKNF